MSGDLFGLADEPTEQIMPAEVVTFPQAESEPSIEPDAEPTIEIEPEPELPAETADTPAVPEPAATGLLSTALVEILPADFPLPLLAKFVPNPALRINVDEAARYALAVVVDGPDGLQRADLALTELRSRLKAIDAHFEEPCSIANALHKRLTAIRGEWQVAGQETVKTVGQRMYTEQRRLEAIAAEERRKAQDEADRQAREAARQEAEAAAKAQAPAPIVEELKRQAETATAPPVATPASAPPKLRGSSAVTTWKARLVGTSGAEEPNPDTANLSVPQRTQVIALLHAILDGKAPLVAISVNWVYLNRRAVSDKSALAIPGIEAFEEGGIRAKAARGR